MNEELNNQTKTCYIVAGPNGAGKTTFALKYLPELTDCQRFINADMIAAGLSPLAPETAQLQASRIFLNEIKHHIELEKSFAFETTLSGKSYAQLIKKLKTAKWTVVLIYLWIPSIEFSEYRVKERVVQGGHDIPLAAIRRRYSKSLFNLFNLYMPLCDYTLCFDNAGNILKPIFDNDSLGIKVIDKEIYNIIRGYKNGQS